MAASLVLHALVFLLWRGAVPFSAPDGDPGRDPAAAGGGGMRAVNAALPDVRTITPPPEPVVAFDAPTVEMPDFETAAAGVALSPVSQLAALPGVGGGAGPGEGGDGTGEAAFTAPVPRSILPHWDPPESVRGMEVTVRVHVDERGRPTGEVELVPPTPDRRFNREIEERVGRMEYTPASRNGRPVAAWAEITFIF